MHDESTRALREARRDSPEDVAAYDVLRERIVASDPAKAPHTARPAFSAVRRWGIAGGITAAVAVAGLAAVLAVTAPSPGSKTAAPSAYAAVRTAVARTAEVANSGTMVTSLRAKWDDKYDSSIALATVLKWHDEDVSLAMAADKESADITKNAREVMIYADGRYYDRSGEPSDATWFHHASADKGGVDNQGSDWVKAARSDISGERLDHLVSVLRDLSQQRNEDGSVTYAGTSTAREIDSAYRDTKGLPYASRPFPKLGDPNATVDIEISVGADGVITSWACEYDWDGAHWVYRCGYRDLGTTPAIVAPKPSEVEESDGTWG